MRITKAMKETHIFFDEASDTIRVSTFNTGLKNRAGQSADKFPDHCRIISDDPEYGDMIFEISKKCFCFRFTSPCSEGRKEQMSRYAKEHNTMRMNYGKEAVAFLRKNKLVEGRVNSARYGGDERNYSHV